MKDRGIINIIEETTGIKETIGILEEITMLIRVAEIIITEGGEID